MDVGSIGVRAGVWVLLAIGCLLLEAPAQADPLYTLIDLGAGDPTIGNGTVTGSNGQTYTFNPAPNDLPAAWMYTSQDVPDVVSVPISPTYPVYVTFSNSTLSAMNSQGLAAGIDLYSRDGHWANGEAFVTQRQPDGSWGSPVPLWSGTWIKLSDAPVQTGLGILGVSSSGQVVGYGDTNPSGSYQVLHLYAYDPKTQTQTDLTNLIQSTKWAPNPPSDARPFWYTTDVSARLDDQGRILTSAFQGYTGPRHELLLVPQGVPDNEVAAPEPSSWLLFAILTGGLFVQRRLRPRGVAKAA